MNTITITIDDDFMNELCESYDDGSCAALADAIIEDVEEGVVILSGTITPEGVAELLAISWVEDVQVD